jgi:hypothetical protein
MRKREDYGVNFGFQTCIRVQQVLIIINLSYGFMYLSKLRMGLIVFSLVALVVADGILGFLGDASMVILQQLKLIIDLYLPY